MKYTAELVSRIALAWMNNRPLSKESRARRKAERAERKQQRRERRMPEKVTVTLSDGSTLERVEPTIPARTSTKVAATGVFFGIPLIQLIQDIEFPWLIVEQFTNSDLFVQLATLALAFITARIAKSPITPKAI